MKQNKLTPGHNLLWESSRMMLPEHREQFLEHRRELGKKTKPVLDDQEMERWEHTIIEAYQSKERVSVTLFDPLEPVTCHGIILDVNPIKKQFKMKVEDDHIQWINLESMTNVTFD